MSDLEYNQNMIYAVGDMDWLLGRAAWDYMYFTVPDKEDPAAKVWYADLEDARDKTGFQTVVYLDE